MGRKGRGAWEWVGSGGVVLSGGGPVDVGGGCGGEMCMATFPVLFGVCRYTCVCVSAGCEAMAVWGREF